MRAKLALAGAVALSSCCAVSGAATLNGSGSLVLTSGGITFTNSGPIGAGAFVVDPSSTGFGALLSGTTATIQALDFAMEPPGVPVDVPHSTPSARAGPA
jgi:hypothetical protein